MTATRDPDRLIRAFLDEGLTELPDHSYDAIRAAVDRTRQRTVLGPWRNPIMSASLRLLGAAAAVAIVVAGLAIIGVPPGPATSPAVPSPTVVVPTDPTFVPADAIRYQWPRALESGHYATAMAWDVPFAMSFTVPAAWESRDVEVIQGDMSVSLQVPWDLYADPCSTTSATIDTGSTTATFAAALAQVRGIDVGTPVAGTYAGRAGTSVTYQATDLPCVGESSRLWSNAAWTILPVTPLGPPWWPVRAGRHQVWVVDVDGHRMAIDSTAGPNATADDEAALQAVLDSISFGPPAEALQLGACQIELSLPAHPAATIGPLSVVPLENASPPILGATPENLFGPPYAHLDFRVSNMIGTGPSEGRPTLSVVPPPGSPHGGFGTQSTSSEDGSLVGSFLLDAPGTWWLRLSILRNGCVWQQPVLVAPS
jgi:hypothetical protein